MADLGIDEVLRNHRHLNANLTEVVFILKAHGAVSGILD